MRCIVERNEFALHRRIAVFFTVDGKCQAERRVVLEGQLFMVQFHDFLSLAVIGVDA